MGESATGSAAEAVTIRFIAGCLSPAVMEALCLLTAPVIDSSAQASRPVYPFHSVGERKLRVGWVNGESLSTERLNAFLCDFCT
jgi:hypothetical protein